MQNLTNIAFDEKTHTYTNNGVVVPSVTQILEACFPFPEYIPKAKREYSMKKGTAVDLMIEYDLKGILDVSSLGMLEPYYQCWLKAKKELKIEKAQTKVMLYSPLISVCGQLDLIDNRLFEIKTGKEYIQHRLQTAAYREMYNESHPSSIVKQRFAIYISEDDPVIVEHKDPNDFYVFNCCLEVFKFKNEHN